METLPSSIPIDPRTKLLHAFITGLLLLWVRAPEPILFHAQFIALTLLLFRLYRPAIKVSGLSAGLFFLFNALPHSPNHSLLFLLSFHVYILFKLTPLFGMFLIITRTISVSDLLTALEKLRLPRTVILPLAVALRFLPTIGYETSCIRDTMKMRNIPLTPFGFLKAPCVMTEYLLLPLLTRCLKIAEELSAAAVVRGIERPGQRGSYTVISLGKSDAAYLLAILLYATFLISYK